MSRLKVKRRILLVTSPEGDYMGYSHKLAFWKCNESILTNQNGRKTSFAYLSKRKLPFFYKGYYFQWIVIQVGDDKDYEMIRKFQPELLNLVR